MVGVLMNARALMALIVINVGLTVGILSSTAFFMLVMMAVITTFMTAPLLRVGLKKAPQTSLAHIPAPIQRRPEQARPVVAASGVATAGDA
jgi:Kef-type K+ transport system membrane component KefB